MQFIPKDEQTLVTEIKQEQEARIIPEGVYQFKVIKCTEGPSKKGNPMFSLQVHVYDINNIPHLVYDWLLTQNASLAYKFRHFCKSIEIMDLYDSGCVGEYQMIDRFGFCKIIHENAFDKNGNPRISLRIDDYVEKPANFVESKEPIVDEDIPF